MSIITGQEPLAAETFPNKLISGILMPENVVWSYLIGSILYARGGEFKDFGVTKSDADIFPSNLRSQRA